MDLPSFSHALTETTGRSEQNGHFSFTPVIQHNSKSSSAGHEEQSNIFIQREAPRSWHNQAPSPNLNSRLSPQWTNEINSGTPVASSRHAHIPAAADHTVSSNARPSTHPLMSPASVNGQEPQETVLAISAPENGPTTSPSVDSDSTNAPKFSGTDEEVINTGQASGPDSTLQGYASVTSPETGTASAADLPISVRKTLVAWFGRHGISRPPPCSIHVNSAQLVHKGLTGTPALYHHRNGLRLDVDLFRLMQFRRGLHNLNDIVMVASTPSLGFLIIGRPRSNGILDGKGFRVWEGVNGSDSDGWAKEETIFKTWDSAAASELSRMHIVRSYLPVVNVRHLLSEAIRIGQVKTPRNGSRMADDSSSTSHDDEDVDHNVTEVIEITSEESSANESDDIHHGASMPQNTDLPPGTILRSNTSYTPQPDNPNNLSQDLPQELLLLMEQWTIQRGTKDPLPCSMRSGGWEKWFHRHEKGYKYIFRQVNGDKVTVRLVRLSSSFDGYINRLVLVAEGPNLAPCLVRVRKQIRSTHGSAVLFHVWRGIRAKGGQGFDPQPVIVKAAPDAIVGILNRLRSRPTPEDTALSPPPKHRKITLRYRKEVHEPSKPEHRNIERYSTKEPVIDPIADTLPKKCEDLINEWFRAHPEHDYSTLPCATGSHENYLYRGHSATPMIWKYKDGRPLQAQMYNLPLPSRHGSVRQRKRVIIVSGEKIGPCIVAHRPRPDEVVLKGAAKIWLGVKGNKHGFEKDVSVFKEFVTGEKFTNVPRVPTPPYRQSFANGSQDDCRSRPPIKRLRPDSDANKHGSALSPATSQPKILAPRRSPVVPLTILRPHLLHNLVCPFYASDKPAPRIRLFNACDTPRKLFAQAMAWQPSLAHPLWQV